MTKPLAARDLGGIVLGGMALCAVLAGCANSRPRSLGEIRDTDYPGTLLAANKWPALGQWRQVVTASYPEGEQSFEAVVLRKDQLLRVVGLSGMGIGFVLERNGGKTSFDNRMGREMPFPPRFILLDVQRTLYPWLAGEPPRDGVREGQFEGEKIVERWRAGRLVERRFSRLNGQPAGEIIVRYEWAKADWTAPSRTVLENGWFGYRMTVQTTEEHRLEGQAP